MEPKQPSSVPVSFDEGGFVEDGLMETKPQIPEDKMTEHEERSTEFLDQVVQQRMTKPMEPSRKSIKAARKVWHDEGSLRQILSAAYAIDFATLQHENNRLMLVLDEVKTSERALRSELQAAQAELKRLKEIEADNKIRLDDRQQRLDELERKLKEKTNAHTPEEIPLQYETTDR